MKKLHVLIPSLVATASMPLVSMVGCGNQDPVKPTETYVVTLFAGQGTFGESNQIILSNIQPGTLLKDVEGYKTPQGESFIGWLNNGKEFAVDQPINSNMLLTAKYNDPQAIHTITLFAGQGMFSDGNNVKKVSVTGDQTTLEQAIGDIEPIGATKFHGWITSTGGQPTMTDPVITDIELSAEYEPAVVKYKAYIVKTDDKNITLDNDDVTAGQQFTTTVEYSAGNISPANISVYVNGTPVSAGITQGEDINHVVVSLTSAQTIGDVAIVVKFETTTNNYSYLCNDPADGLTLTDSEIQPSAITIGIINSPVNIKNNWELDKVVMGGVDVTDHFWMVPDVTDDKKVKINIYDEFVINDDILVWLKPITPSLSWTSEDDPFPIEPLSSAVPYDQALEQFYEFALNDKLNFIKDFINSKALTVEYSFDITVTHLDFDSINEVFACSWTFFSTDPEGFLYGRVQNLKFKVVESSAGKYETKGLPALMSQEDAYNFLVADSSWSMLGFTNEPGGSSSYAFDANIIPIIWSDEFLRQLFINQYDMFCLSHPIYYLQNITPGP